MKNHIKKGKGKGKKERNVILSKNVVNLLSKYFKVYKPKEYIIEGQKGGKYSPKIVQSIFNAAIKKAEIKKRQLFTHCAIVLQLTY